MACPAVVLAHTLVNDSLVSELDVKFVGPHCKTLPKGMYTIDARSLAQQELRARASFEVKHVF